MRLFVSLDTPLARAVVAAAERDRRRPCDELMVLAEAELRRRGMLEQHDTPTIAEVGCVVG